MIDKVHLEPAKYVVTNDHGATKTASSSRCSRTGRPDDGGYLTAATPGAFKGYHLHRVRAARYVCLRGRMRIILYQRQGEARPRRAHPRRGRAEAPVHPEERGHRPREHRRGSGLAGELPDPPYDPALKDEQVEYTQAELEAGVVK